MYEYRLCKDNSDYEEMRVQDEKQGKSNIDVPKVQSKPMKTSTHSNSRTIKPTKPNVQTTSPPLSPHLPSPSPPTLQTPTPLPPSNPSNLLLTPSKYAQLPTKLSAHLAHPHLFTHPHKNFNSKIPLSLLTGRFLNSTIAFARHSSHHRGGAG